MKQGIIYLLDKGLTDLADTSDGYLFWLHLYYPLLVRKLLMFNEGKVFLKTFLIEFKFEEYRVGSRVF